MPIDNSRYITEQSEKLNDLLIAKEIKTELEHDDGYKHVDIAIPNAHLYIEIDGPQHFTDPNHIVSDFERDHYSDREGIDTLHVPNVMIETYPNEIAHAIAELVKRRLEINK